MIIRTKRSNHAASFPHGKRHTAQRNLSNTPVKLVGPGRTGEQLINRCRNFFGSRPGTRHLVQPRRELISTGRQVLTEVVQDLRPQMRRRPRPALRPARSLNRIPHILPVRQRRLSDQLAAFRINLGRITAVRPRLFATDVELRGPVYRLRFRIRPRAEPLHFGKRLGLARRFCVGSHPFRPTFATKAAFTHTTKRGRRIKHVCPVHPNHTRGQLGCNIERHIDVLGPDRRRQAVARVVRQFDGFRRRTERHAHQHWAKYLILHQRIGCAQTGDQRRRVKASDLGQIARRLIHLTCCVRINQTCDCLQLLRINDRAHVDGLVERRPHPKLVHPHPELGIKAFRHAFLNQ